MKTPVHPRALKHPSLLPSLVLLAALGATSCGAAEAIRKEAPTAAEANGEKCDAKADTTNVYVVDLPPDKRSDVELALGTDGLAVVSFDCTGMKILKTCKAAGSYEYRGTSPKERVLTLESGDAIRAALPLGGAGIAASFEAEASTGTKFDLGLVLVGQSIGSASSFSVAELNGNCAGATHVITAGKMGAFAMGTSSKAEMKTAVEVFGAGVGASSGSSKLAKNRDGSIDACSAAQNGAEEPPKNCDALLAVELTRVSKGFGAVNIDPMFEIGYFDDGCKSDLATCETDCNAGKAKACRQNGISLIIGGQGIDKNIPRGLELLKKGCDLGDVKGCAALATALFFEERYEEASPLAEKGCNVSNDGDACYTYALVLDRFKKDPTKAKKYYEKACYDGVKPACKDAGIPQDDKAPEPPSSDE